MVALFRLFKHSKVSVHFLFFCKRRAVNTGEHFVMLVPAPIRTRDTRQAERLDFTRRGKVRTSAKVDKIPLLIEGNFFALGQIFNELHFIILGKIFHELNRLVLGEREPLDRQIALDNLFHFRLYLFKVGLGDGRHEIHVVIKAVVNDGAYRKLAGRINDFKRLCKHVCAGVAIHV